MNHFLAALKNVNGQIELGRLLLAGSGVMAIVTPIVFQGLDMAHNNWHFDVTAWCVAYPGGLAALNSIGIFAIGKKEKDVAIARQTQDIAATGGKAVGD